MAKEEIRYSHVLSRKRFLVHNSFTFLLKVNSRFYLPVESNYFDVTIRISDYHGKWLRWIKFFPTFFLLASSFCLYEIGNTCIESTIFDIQIF